MQTEPTLYHSAANWIGANTTPQGSTSPVPNRKIQPVSTSPGLAPCKLKILIPIAAVIAAAFFWLNRHPDAVRPSEANEESQSLEPEFAVDVREQSNQIRNRVPIELPGELETNHSLPNEGFGESGAGSSGHGNKAPRQASDQNDPQPAGSTPNDGSGAQQPLNPKSTGPREEIIGGIKSVYGTDGISLMASGPWINGKKTGFWQEFNVKGQVIRAENYTEGELDGLSETWFDDGSPRSSVPMKAGKIDGQASYWLANGQVDESRSGLYQEGAKVEE